MEPTPLLCVSPGIAARDVAGGLRSLAQAARGVAALTSDPSVQAIVLDTASDVLDKASSLIEEAKKAAGHPGDPESQQRLAQVRCWEGLLPTPPLDGSIRPTLTGHTLHAFSGLLIACLSESHPLSCLRSVLDLGPKLAEQLVWGCLVIIAVALTSASSSFSGRAAGYRPRPGVEGGSPGLFRLWQPCFFLTPGGESCDPGTEPLC